MGMEESPERRSMREPGQPESTGADMAVFVSMACVGLSLYEFFLKGKHQRGIFVGLWPPTILAFASYFKQRAMEERMEESVMSGSAMRGIRNLL